MCVNSKKRAFNFSFPYLLKVLKNLIAGAPGFEPGSAVLETAILPLNDAPTPPLGNWRRKLFTANFCFLVDSVFSTPPTSLVSTRSLKTLGFESAPTAVGAHSDTGKTSYFFPDPLFGNCCRKLLPTYFDLFVSRMLSAPITKFLILQFPLNFFLILARVIIPPFANGTAQSY
jgi:hypothetical protein